MFFRFDFDSVEPRKPENSFRSAQYLCHLKLCQCSANYGTNATYRLEERPGIPTYRKGVDEFGENGNSPANPLKKKGELSSIARLNNGSKRATTWLRPSSSFASSCRLRACRDRCRSRPLDRLHRDHPTSHCMYPLSVFLG